MEVILLEIEKSSDLKRVLDFLKNLGIAAKIPSEEDLNRVAFQKRFAARQRFVEMVEENKKQLTEFPTEQEIAEAIAEARFEIFGSAKEFRHVESNH